MTTPPPSPSQLPPDRSIFVGRSSELAHLLAGIESGERLLSLVGPAGIGKTRLARRVAIELEPQFLADGGVWLCDMHEVRTAAELVARVASRLGILVGDASPERLAEALAGRGPTLLVLDNCEYLAPEARAVLETCLDHAPEARFLVTSLQRLALPSELGYELPPLGPSDAAALYLEHARRSEPGVELDPADVAELVQRLDRNPLAIQLAAARVRALRPRQLLARLDRRLSLLSGGEPGRHESLRRAIRCSWELLTPCEASALSQCAVFAGGFTLEAAEAVLDLSAFPEAPPVLDTIAALRDKALIQGSGSDPLRFSLFESVRAYALDELAADAAAAAHLRHARYYLAFCAAEVDGEIDAPQLRRLIEEEDNLLAAHRRTIAIEPRLATELALALEPLGFLRGFRSARPLVEEAVEGARSSGDALSIARALRARAALLARSGAGATASALEHDLVEAIERAREVGAAAVECQARIELARLTALQGEAARAVAMLEDCLRVAERKQLTLLEGIAENQLGVIHNASGRPEQALSHLERAMQLLRGRGAVRREVQVHGNLGAVLVGLGRVPEAERMMQAARTLASSIGDRVEQANAAVSLGNVALTDGRLDEAEALLSESRALQRELHQPLFEALAAGNLGVVAFERGRIRAASHLLDEALSTFRAAGQKRFLAAFGAAFGAVLAAAGEVERAREVFEESREILAELGDTETLRSVSVFEGFLDLAVASRADRAEAELHRAAARERLTPGTFAPGGPRRIAMRLLQRAIAGWQPSTSSDDAAPSRDGGAQLRVGPEAFWFEVAGRTRCELRTRKPLRRLMHRLVEQRLLSPGVGLTIEQLFQAGWPGEQAVGGSAAGRVYVAIRMLRAAGLEEVLLRQDDGYLLDPAVAVSAPLS